MKTGAVASLAICLALACNACDAGEKKSDARRPAASASAALADGDELAITSFEAMNKVIVDNQDDCEKMAAELKKFTVANDATLKTLKDRSAKLTVTDKKAFDQKYGPRIQASMQKMMPAAAKCQQSKSVEAAMRAIPE